ncbi:MAG: Hint domain-containing protein [Planctomycetota bacterium]
MSPHLPYPGTVAQVQEHEGVFECYDVLLESGNRVSVAERHYFLTESGKWLAVQNLRAGMRLQTARDSIAIVNVTRRSLPYVGRVYNLKVEGSDRYLVGKDAVVVRDY